MKAQRRIWVIAGGAAALAGGVGLLSGQGRWAAVLVAVGVLLPVAALLADKAAARSGDLDIEKVADRFADLVRDQWDKEATRRGVGRPPLEVFWQAADADLSHSWPDLLAQAATRRSGPVSAAPGSGPDDLAGHGALLTAYGRSPCGRLVVLGEPGAGKTILLLRLVLDLLARRQPGQPVPLLLPLASWNPDGPSLYTWLEGQILREYPHLAAVDSSTGRTRAGALLDAGLILPVLDGLDEIREGGRDKALRAINDGLRSNIGLVLSCRSAEFRTAVQPRPELRPIHLVGAAAIRLTPLATTAIRDYLLAGAGADGSARWAQALTALADSASPVAQALTTPLTAFLASTVYNPRQGESTLGLPNPTDLTALPTAVAVEQYLLAGFIPAAYRLHPDQPTRWTAEQASRYHTFLARHIEYRRYTTNLAWWEPAQAAPRAYRVLSSALTVGIMVGLVTGLIAGLMVGLVNGLATALIVGLVGALVNRELFAGQGASPRESLIEDRTGGLVVGLTAGLLGGLVGGLAGGLIGGSVTTLAVWLVAVPVGAFGAGLVAWLVAGFKGAPIPGLVSGLLCGLAVGLTAGPVDGIVFGIVTALIFGLMAGLVINQPVGLVAGLVGGLIARLVAGLVAGFVAGLATGPAAGLAGGLVAGLGPSMEWHWAQLTLTRPWLAARRQQPLHLIAFLEDAHNRGVLRQAGAVWEFRHANLQRYLAGPP